MKFLLILVLFISCSPDYTDLHRNINDFTRNCKRLSKCIDKPYRVLIELENNNHFKCVIKYSEITDAYLYSDRKLDITKRPTFGYDFLEPAIRVCKMLKKQGDYSDLNQNQIRKYKKCRDLNKNSREQKKLCWELHIKGDSSGS